MDDIVNYGGDIKTSQTAEQNKMATDKIKVAVRVRPFSRRGKQCEYIYFLCTIKRQQ